MCRVERGKHSNEFLGEMDQFVSVLAVISNTLDQLN